MTTQPMQDSDFWRNMGKQGMMGGLFDLGAGIYSTNQANKEASSRLRQAQGPLYDKAMSAAGTTLDRAGSFDPRAAGRERFNAAQGLLAGADSKSLDDLMRRLHVQGQSGIGSFSGVAPGGAAVNPQMEAYFKAKADRDARMAYDSLGEGEAQLDRQLNRSGMLQQQAAQRQNTGIQAQSTQPSRSAQTLNLLRGAGSILKDTGLLNDGLDWLKNTFGNGASDYWGGSDFSLGF